MKLLFFTRYDQEMFPQLRLQIVIVLQIASVKYEKVLPGKRWAKRSEVLHSLVAEMQASSWQLPLDLGPTCYCQLEAHM